MTSSVTSTPKSTDPSGSDHHGGAPIRLTLADALTWLRSLGWGEPLEDK